MNETISETKTALSAAGWELDDDARFCLCLMKRTQLRRCKMLLFFADLEGGQRKSTAPREAAVVGDTFGDPLKDTSGPALNIVMKLMAIISLVFANLLYFSQIKDGHQHPLVSLPDKLVVSARY
jgi:hypothetical protein